MPGRVTHGDLVVDPVDHTRALHLGRLAALSDVLSRCTRGTAGRDIGGGLACVWVHVCAYVCVCVREQRRMAEEEKATENTNRTEWMLWAVQRTETTETCESSVDSAPKLAAES